MDYPFVLITGRQLEHWHTGSMTRRASVLDAIEPVATASLHGADLHKLGVAPGDTITVRSRRGDVAGADAALTALAADPDAGVRAAAIRAMPARGRIPDLLAPGLRDESAMVRIAAAEVVLERLQ